MSDYPPNQLIPGTVYQVVQLLGQGGMGTVYEVEDTTVGKRYVLKTLHAQLRDRQELADRLHKEARVLAKLSHPNIVEVVTAGMTADALKLPYFVMQKLNGHTLRSVLMAKRRLPLETAYSIAIDLLDALDHAHAAGVIHRDVKPENIFLHRGPNDAHQTKLLDFGVMRLLSGDEPATGSRFVGTLRYAPPEQLRGGKVTARTDLYAAGLVLYEMIAGGGPFDEETTDKGIANAHLHKAPPRLARATAVPEELETLVASALAKSAEARPKDAFTFASRLRSLAKDAADARARSSQSGKTVESVLGGMGAPPSATNLDDATDVASSQGFSQPHATTLENAGPPTSAPVPTLRLGELHDSVDRAAPTRTSAPTHGATTTGATESVASGVPTRKTSGLVVGMAALATLAVVGAGVGLFVTKSRSHATAPTVTASAAEPATASATTTPPPLEATTATAAASATAATIPTATATATPTATTAAPRAIPHSPRRPPAAAPPPEPAPPPPAPAKPRLPGPGF